MYEELELRELLRQSQSNVTSDPELGLEYAAAAYDRALHPEFSQSDPTAAGEAAAKAGFRAEQAGRDNMEVARWFADSYHALEGEDPQIRRERVATHLLEGRALALRCLGNTAVDNTTKRQATQAFNRGNRILLEQHEKGHRWDPYATMLSRHQATHEAINGSALNAAGIAIQGIWRAARSRREGANTPAGRLKHIAFTEKQGMLNYTAALLALSRPLDFAFRKQRERIARWMLG